MSLHRGFPDNKQRRNKVRISSFSTPNESVDLGTEHQMAAINTKRKTTTYMYLPDGRRQYNLWSRLPKTMNPNLIKALASAANFQIQMTE